MKFHTKRWAAFGLAAVLLTGAGAGGATAASDHDPTKPQGPPGMSDVEADGPYPGSTDLGSLPDQGDNSDAKVPADGNAHVVWVQCAPGKTAIGGGFRFGQIHDAHSEGAHQVIEGLYVQASQPAQAHDGDLVYQPIPGDEAGSFEPNAWAVEVVNNGEAEQTVRPFVVCATVN